MEQELNFALLCVNHGVPIRYISKTTQVVDSSGNEIIIDKSKIEMCPNETHVLNALQKRIGRNDIFKNQKYTLGLCILLLVSSGYCITSMVLVGIDNSFIERCWECINVVSQDIEDIVPGWLSICMEGRSSAVFSMLFCEPRNSPTEVKYLDKSISGSGRFLNLDMNLHSIPKTTWHRNDTLRYSMILHLQLRDAFTPDNC